MELVSADFLKKYISDKVESFQIGKGEGGIPLCSQSPDSPPSLAAFCDMIFIKYVIGKLPQDNKTSTKWANYINLFQDLTSGWFIDKNSEWVPKERVKPWLFGFALRALNVLGSQPKHPLQFLSEWLDPQKLKSWIFTGNDVMHMGIAFLRYIDKKRIPYEFESVFFDILESDSSRMNPSDRRAFAKTIDKHPNYKTLANKIHKDDFHTLFVYYAANRSIPGIELYIDWTLEEQNEEGFFYWDETVAPIYSHMDGLANLVEFYKRSEYRKEDIICAVEKGLNAVLSRNNFHRLWESCNLHQLLALCETIAKATQILNNHPINKSPWRSVWHLDLWYVSEKILPF